LEKSEILKIIGKRIKELRESQGLSQVDLVGKMSGEIDPTNISRIESGRTNPTVYTIFRIAEAMEIHPKEILNYDFSSLIFSPLYCL
jgi:transcriptional regulator with XRE-family HTH domain